ncbi:MAG TPA: GTP 3',8-cyclase MoaA [Microthrixaceae bacterium]|nr:GTP 3',8-cyclase MoaA [Microthrixaceae bacterium]
MAIDGAAARRSQLGGYGGNVLHGPTEQLLVDSYGRTARDLRISVTDRCDLRCTYCMPEEGLEWLDSAKLLTFDEIVRLTAVLVDLGITSVRLTGGEPLMRPHLSELVSSLSSLGLDDLSMTTNGTTLARHAAALAKAGLKRVNVSLDSLVAARVLDISRRDVLDKVLAGIDAANAAGLSPVKVNCVLIRGKNDDEILDFAEFARRTGAEVRFIEDMPLGADQQWSSAVVVPGSEVVDLISTVHRLTAEQRGSEPASTYTFADGAPGRIGVIASVTEPFCASCDRLRLTADGFLRTCLFAHVETDLLTPMRAGATDAELVALIRSAVSAKGPGHAIGLSEFEQPVRFMSRIGG